jgi:hypothetical protein
MIFFGKSTTYLEVIQKFKIRLLENVIIRILSLLRCHKEGIDSEESSELFIEEVLLYVGS